jgi:exopolysaccharide biosynthesis polyprenyl glycosylphosphotransferase
MTNNDDSGTLMTEKERANQTLVVNWPGWLPPLIDAALIMVAFLLAYYARYELQLLRPLDEAFRAPFSPFIPYAVLFAIAMILSAQQNNLYRHVRGRGWLDDALTLGNITTNSTVITMGISFFLQPLVFSRLLLLYAAVFSLILLAAARFIYRAIRARQRQRGIGVERVLVVGAGEIGRAVLRNMLARPDLGYQVVGFVDDDPQRSESDIGRLRALGKVANLSAIIVQEKVDLVISTLSWEHHREILSIVQECDRRDVQVRIVPDLFQLKLNRMRVENLAGIPLLGLQGRARIPGAERLLKRILDVGLIALTAVVWVPLFGLIALAIRLEGPGAVLYGQERVGQGGRRFRVWKFRSMVENADELKARLVAEQGLDPRHPKLKDDPRITQVGKVIRRLSLDELPQIINILQGDMSIVGPRPPTPDEVDLYEPWHMQRLQTRGGLTGLWQVSGRSDVPFEEMVLLDLYYIENWSLMLDLQIMLRTVPRVLFGSGAY